MSCFISAKVIAEDLVLVEWCEGIEFLEQLWSNGKSRKSSTCAGSLQPYKPGDFVYRPVGNASNRMRRILATWMDANATQKKAVAKKIIAKKAKP